MKRTLIHCALAISFLSLNVETTADDPSGPGIDRSVIAKGMVPSFANDRVLVKFIPGTAASEIGKANRQTNGRTLNVIENIGIHVISVPAGTVTEKINLYSANPNVVFAEPDFNRVLVIPGEGDPAATGTTYFTEQWGLDNQGQLLTDPSTGAKTLFGSSDADIDASEGWDISKGDSNVVIAVLDTGLDIDAGCPGYNPALPNLDFVGKCVEAKSFVEDYSDTPHDVAAHGSHVAGIAAANTDNDIGIAGVGWNSSIANLKACFEYYIDLCPPLGCDVIVGVCPVSASATAMIHAADQGYQVINMSYASDEIDENGDPAGLGGMNATEAAAVAYAWSKGVVLVSAAGNDGANTKTYPAAYDEVIAVGATERNDDRASFSNFGNWVSVMAPGDTIISTIPNEICVFYSEILGIPFFPDSDVCLDWYSGTSMASPHVAGAASVVWGYLFGDTSPVGCVDANGTPCNEVVRSHLENGADTTGTNNQNMLAWSKNGRLNLAGALNYNGGGDPPGGGDNQSPVAGFTYNCNATTCSFTSTSTDSDGTIATYDWDFGDGKTSLEANPNHQYASQGRYTVSFAVTDDDGASDNVSASFRVKKRGSTSGSAGGGDGGGGDTTIEVEKGRKKCNDGKDNDGDGLIDADDPDC
ncbi:MAG: S8 family serine peptidase [Porticoccus sp.]